MKYIQTFGEESFTFIKILVHLYQVKTINPHFNGRIILKISNSNEIFLENSSTKLKVNSYIQLYGRINQISTLKKSHTRINFICSNCGNIGAKNLAYANIKSGLSIHTCPDQQYGQKITKEYTNPIHIREFYLEFNNEIVLCIINESLFNIKFLKGEVKISGIVKTRNENSKNENLFIKYIDIISIEQSIIAKSIRSLTEIDNDMMFQLGNFSKIKNKLAFCYNKLLSKVDYNNLIFLFFLFSLSKNSNKMNDNHLRIHMLNLTKNELSNYKHIKRLNALFPMLYSLIGNDSSTDANNYNNTLKNNCFSESKHPSYANYPSNNLIINNYDTKSELVKAQLKTMNTSYSSFTSTNANVNSLIDSPSSNQHYSLLTISKSLDLAQYDYDIISITSDINDSSNDRQKSNQIITNQFTHKRHKRPYQEMVQTQINQIDKINPRNFLEDLYTIDTTSLSDYFKNEICIEENDTIDEYNFSENFIGDYIQFVNEYLHPIIPDNCYKDFYFLSEHLKHQFNDLSYCGLFDINWISINTLAKLARISARIEMREEVLKEDIVKSYFLTKEFLQQNYIVFLLSRKERLKGNKAKLCFIIEKLRQYAKVNGRKISLIDIKSFGQFSDAEYNQLIEKLNYEGILLKLNSKQYQIVN